jgi:hypothetical protein
MDIIKKTSLDEIILARPQFADPGPHFVMSSDKHGLDPIDGKRATSLTVPSWIAALVILGARYLSRKG